MQKNQDISYKQELLRKGIHLSSLSIPIIYGFIMRETALLILFPLTVLAFIIDIGRHYVPAIRSVMHTIIGNMLRPHELDSNRKLLNGATYVLLSACLCVFAFPKIIAITAFSILIISDTASALIGRKWGKRKFLDKSAVGSIAFVVSALIVVVIIGLLWNLSPIFYLIGAIAAVVGAIVEAASIRLQMDDNFSIPITVGIILWLGFYLSAPFLTTSY